MIHRQHSRNKSPSNAFVQLNNADVYQSKQQLWLTCALSIYRVKQFRYSLAIILALIIFDYISNAISITYFDPTFSKWGRFCISSSAVCISSVPPMIMGSKPSRQAGTSRKTLSVQLSTHFRGVRRDPYQLLSSDITGKSRELKSEQQKRKQMSRESSYQRPLRTKVGTDGHVWFY